MTDFDFDTRRVGRARGRLESGSIFDITTVNKKEAHDRACANFTSPLDARGKGLEEHFEDSDTDN